MFQGAQRIFFELWGDSLMPGHDSAPMALVLGLWAVFGAQNKSLKGTGRITLISSPLTAPCLYLRISGKAKLLKNPKPHGRIQSFTLAVGLKAKCVLQESLGAQKREIQAKFPLSS